MLILSNKKRPLYCVSRALKASVIFVSLFIFTANCALASELDSTQSQIVIDAMADSGMPVGELERGRAFLRDGKYEEGVLWLTKAAQNEEHSDIHSKEARGEAAYMLALIYSESDPNISTVIEPDLKKAGAFIDLSASLGYADALEIHGKVLEKSTAGNESCTPEDRVEMIRAGLTGKEVRKFCDGTTF